MPQWYGFDEKKKKMKNNKTQIKRELVYWMIQRTKENKISTLDSIRSHII